MRAGAISAGLFGFARGESTSANEVVAGKKKPVASTASFAAEKFASAQIRGLVRQVFLSGSLPIKQVVFTSMQPEIDVLEVCRRVGQALALETAKDVVIVIRDTQSDLQPESQAFNAMRRGARQLEENLWSLTIPGDDESSDAGSVHSRIAKIRHEFEYSLIAASSGALDDALFLGQVSDGIVLVLSALRTRRAVAVRFRNALVPLRLLGTVLIDRDFPVPAAIYKHL